MNYNEEWFDKRVLERFLRYVKIETTSDRHIDKIPSTEGQWEILKLLENELRDLGLKDISLNENGYLIARIEKNKNLPWIGFLAHVDTSADVSGKNVNPQIHKNYDLSEIKLKNNQSLNPEIVTDLKDFKGDTIISSDGTTLLGADDKAGIAEIMTALEYLLENKNLETANIEIMFSPDEETGRGMDLVPLENLKSKVCYTMDGDGKGSLEAECFYAYSVSVDIEGKVIHLGNARGKLINAVTVASKFVSMLPQSESPESTDERYGYYCPLEMNAGLDSAHLEILLRDFERKNVENRVKVIENIGETLKVMFPGVKIKVEAKKSYSNMRDFIKGDERILAYAEEAIRKTGLTPEIKSIRGGTDGARLSEMGIPCPNLFAGGYDFHSLTEWIPLSLMSKASILIVELLKLWGSEKK